MNSQKFQLEDFTRNPENGQSIGNLSVKTPQEIEEVKDKDPKTGKFLPGNKLSPGRKEGSKNLKTLLADALDQMADKKDYTYSEALIKTILKRAIVDGNFLFANMIMERMLGKVANEDRDDKAVTYQPVFIQMNNYNGVSPVDPLLKLQKAYEHREASQRANTAELHTGTTPA